MEEEWRRADWISEWMRDRGWEPAERMKKQRVTVLCCRSPSGHLPSKWSSQLWSHRLCCAQCGSRSDIPACRKLGHWTLPALGFPLPFRLNSALNSPSSWPPKLYSETMEPQSQLKHIKRHPLRPLRPAEVNGTRTTLLVRLWLSGRVLKRIIYLWMNRPGMWCHQKQVR